MKITIEGGEGSDWHVFMGDKSCHRLCWDEMLGQVAKLTLEMPPIYMMKTESEWDERNRRMDELSFKRGVE